MLGRKTQNDGVEPNHQKGFDDFELRLGDVLRGERATLGKSLLDIQRELKIKAPYIAAIENSDPSAFETPGFIAGYVRSYAKYLELDPDWAFEKFCAESGFSGVEGLAATKASSAGRKKPRRFKSDDPLLNSPAPYIPVGESALSQVQPGAIGSFAVIVALIGAIGFGGWTVLQEVQRVQFAPIDQTAGVSTSVTEVSPEQTELSDNELASSAGVSVAPPDTLERLYRPQALDVPVLVARDGPIVAIDPRSSGNLTSPQVTAPEVDLAALDDFEPLVPNVQVLEDEPSQLAIFAVRPSWVRVSSVDGTVLFEKILDAGERYELSQVGETPVLRAGNSGSVYFDILGETFGPVGPGASVAKNVALSVEQIVTNYEIADPNADADLTRVLTASATE